MESPGTHTLFVVVCWNCKVNGSKLQPLQRCGGCQLVSYCSKHCQKEDRYTHKFVCNEFPVVDGKNALHTTGPWEEHIARLLKQAAELKFAECFATPLFLRPWVCHTCHEASRERLTVCKCLCVSYCSRLCSDADKQHKKDCSQLGGKIDMCSQKNLCLSYPSSLFYAIYLVQECYLHLQELSTLTIHIVTGNIMMDDMQKENALRLFWDEGYIHHFPKLKHLKLIFIMQGKEEPPFYLNTEKNPIECQDCVKSGRVVTYSLQQMKYNMFFSSKEYSKPNVVAVYGNNQEMSASEQESIQSQISYRNMTHSRDSLVVLMDATKDLVKQGVRAMNAAQPVEQVLPILNNPWKGFTLHPAIVNEKSYFACLVKLHGKK